MSANYSHQQEPAFATLSARDLLQGLLDGTNLMAVVPMTLSIVERDPLASGGCFPGDLVRGLMEISGQFWGCHPRLYTRYVAALRACAGARRLLPPAERMEFWSILDLPCPEKPDGARSTVPD